MRTLHKSTTTPRTDRHRCHTQTIISLPKQGPPGSAGSSAKPEPPITPPPVPLPKLTGTQADTTTASSRRQRQRHGTTLREAGAQPRVAGSDSQPRPQQTERLPPRRRRGSWSTPATSSPSRRSGFNLSGGPPTSGPSCAPPGGATRSRHERKGATGAQPNVLAALHRRSALPVDPAELPGAVGEDGPAARRRQPSRLRRGRVRGGRAQ
jgi:hypothetical protein